MILLPVADGFACTGFFSSKDNLMLVGNNEDWYNPFSQFWVIPGNKKELGVIYFGFEHKFPFGGMNEKGLFFDSYSSPALEAVNSKNKKKFNGDLVDKVMKECGTVEEALTLISDYNLEFMSGYQIFLADKTGNSAIIEGDEIIKKKGDYQIATNFHQSKTKDNSIRCWRYNRAERMLKNSNTISIDFFKSILNETSQNGQYPTQYSNIYDLKNGIIHLYQFQDFTNVCKIDLKAELKKGKHARWLSSLFPKNDLKDSYIRMYVHQGRIKLQPPHFINFKILFFACAIIFISVIAFKVLYLIFRFLLKSKKVNYPASYKESAPLEKAAHYFGLVVSVFGLVFVYAFWKYTEVINYGLPCWNAPGLTKIEQLLLLVPLIMGICASVQVIFTILAWLKGYWSLKMRCHYTLVTIVAGLVVGLLIYWDLLKFCIGNQ